VNESIFQLKQADKTPMVDHAVLALKEYILGGNLIPGTVLPSERDMAKAVGVSRFSMREALRVLQVLGLIDISQGRRTRVAGNSISPVTSLLGLTLQRSGVPKMQLIEARRSLEGHIARFAATRAKPHHLEALRVSIADLQRRPNDLSFCVEKDLEFHSTLVKASGNVAFEIVLAPLMELLRDQRNETIRHSGVEPVIQSHARILSAIQARDSDLAERCMDEHLAKAEEDVREIEQMTGHQATGETECFPGLLRPV
jgi:GntR family transcriptional regulator, transcriptional repressor for pyruvate dehydrogenase complex